LGLSPPVNSALSQPVSRYSRFRGAFSEQIMLVSSCAVTHALSDTPSYFPQPLRSGFLRTDLRITPPRFRQVLR
jgi:hypothetical protein